MTKAVRGVLVQCDASIKAIIVQIDAGRNEYIIEELDDETLLVQHSKLNELKQRLKDKLKDTIREPEESESE